jgi:hypothetical protein
LLGYLLLPVAVVAGGLEQWKTEIEQVGGAPVVVVRVETDKERNELRAPEDLPHRAAAVKLLSNEGFLRQFVAAHALSVNWYEKGQTVHFIFLNMARAEEWDEEGLLAHEYGHAWLHALGYAMARVPQSHPSCLATHAGDVVEHVLIRKEAVRRGLDVLAYFKRNVEAALASEGAGEAREGCQRLAQLALSVDATLAFPELRDALAQKFPGLRAPAAELIEMLAAGKLDDREEFRAALEKSLAVFAGNL